MDEIEIISSKENKIKVKTYLLKNYKFIKENFKEMIKF